MTKQEANDTSPINHNHPNSEKSVCVTDIESDDEQNPVLRKTLIMSIGGVALLFLAAFLLGYSTAILEHGVPSLIDAVIIGLGLLFIAGVVLLCVKLWPDTGPEPVGPSVKRSRDLMVLLIGLSIVAGVAFALIEGPENNLLFSNDPIGSTPAIIVLFGLLIIAPIITLLWWRSIDEHEADAYRYGSVVSLHFYFFLAPGWWIAARAGWVPSQDPMIVFLAVCVVWTAAWFYKKFT
ncbi:hypothetical protein [uncultured Erythrobacter sp.]|uniref:hypothetical protein n=1 Tax=uncultured Erythrobacter sp. TaxID=263913 RepID=UPI002629B6B3|nr:hypothetical protein [uncultured Erythrobacter sp.]